jgi:integrase/recombinase XerD
VFSGGDSKLVYNFGNYLERVGRAPGTAEIYLRIIRELVEATRKHPVALTPGELDAYLAKWRDTFFCEHGRFPAPATYRNRVIALRAFYAWMERFDLLRDPDGLLLPNPMRRVAAPRVDQRANDWLRPGEDRALLSAAIPRHEHFLVMLLRWTGLRVGEAVSLTLFDVDLTPRNETIFVRASKSRAGRRAIPVLPMLLPDLRERVRAISTRTQDADAPILLTRNGTAMKRTYVWRVVTRAAFRAGVRVIPCDCATQQSVHDVGCPRTRTGEHLSRVSPHTLRRTFGSYLLNSGVRLEVVSKFLGHATTSVTEKAYAELLYETARREVFAALQGTSATTYLR